jgi:hypothetical protein
MMVLVKGAKGTEEIPKIDYQEFKSSNRRSSVRSNTTSRPSSSIGVPTPETSFARLRNMKNMQDAAAIRAALVSGNIPDDDTLVGSSVVSKNEARPARPRPAVDAGWTDAYADGSMQASVVGGSVIESDLTTGVAQDDDDEETIILHCPEEGSEQNTMAMNPLMMANLGRGPKGHHSGSYHDDIDPFEERDSRSSPPSKAKVTLAMKLAARGHQIPPRGSRHPSNGHHSAGQVRSNDHQQGSRTPTHRQSSGRLIGHRVDHTSRSTALAHSMLNRRDSRSDTRRGSTASNSSRTESAHNSAHSSVHSFAQDLNHARQESVNQVVNRVRSNSFRSDLPQQSLHHGSPLDKHNKSQSRQSSSAHMEREETSTRASTRMTGNGEEFSFTSRNSPPSHRALASPRPSNKDVLNAQVRESGSNNVTPTQEALRSKHRL